MTESSNSDDGIQYAIAFFVIGLFVWYILTPFITELNSFYKTLLSTFYNYSTAIIIIMILLIPGIVITYHKIISRRFRKKADEKETKRMQSEEYSRASRIEYLKKEIEDLTRNRKYTKAREFSRELRWMEGDFSDKGEGVEYNDEGSVIVKRGLDFDEESEEVEEAYPEEEDEEEVIDEDEEVERDYQNRKKYKININVDFDKIFYKKKELNEDSAEYLIKKGYSPFRYKSILSGKNEDYILKPRHNESLKHMVMIYDIKDYLDSIEVNCGIYTTRMPDVVIYFSKKRIALEVETGTVMTNMKKFREKLDLLNSKYGKNWYFIVTDRKLIKKYRKFGKVIDPRFIKFNLNKIIKNT